jgi:UDP-N-acetylmuramyl pentapeptide phosphotransferase/UDP-N-acetylglucosamine-1-phosphate transferase
MNDAMIVAGAAAAAALLCRTLLPAFRRMFLVEPVSRSSHRVATPQGGGLVVVPAALVGAALMARGHDVGNAAAASALIGLAALGALDDWRGLSPLTRLGAQVALTGLAVFASPNAWSIAPHWAMIAVLVVCAVWFVNLTNFMDGLDLMTAAEFIPAFAVAAILLPEGPPRAASLAFAAALAGFATVNRPPARLFLGDSGSLPIGLCGALIIIALCAAHGPFTALLPFLYYIADATLTLMRRAMAGEKVWQAHRTHFYQIATAKLSAPRVVARVALLNVALCALAIVSAASPWLAQIALLAIGAALTAALLIDFARRAKPG